jgi:hypothetical protein
MQSANMTATTTKNTQRDIVAQCRAESVLDRRVRLGCPPLQPQPLVGPSAQSYFAAKHRAGTVGRFYLCKFERPKATYS